MSEMEGVRREGCEAGQLGALQQPLELSGFRGHERGGEAMAGLVESRNSFLRIPTYLRIGYIPRD